MFKRNYHNCSGQRKRIKNTYTCNKGLNWFPPTIVARSCLVSCGFNRLHWNIIEHSICMLYEEYQFSRLTSNCFFLIVSRLRMFLSKAEQIICMIFQDCNSQRLLLTYWYKKKYRGYNFMDKHTCYYKMFLN